MSEGKITSTFAEVEMVCRGKNGCYARVFANDYGTITFSLHTNVWEGGDHPGEGELVVLSKLRYLHNKGWRAEHARRPNPEEVSQYLGEGSQ